MSGIYGTVCTIWTPEELAERATWHKETWFEREIPEAIYEDISEYIHDKIKEFERKCSCGLCKLNSANREEKYDQ